MIKKHKLFVISNILLILSFIFLLAAHFYIKSNLVNLRKENIAIVREIDDINKQLFLENSLGDDLKVAHSDNGILASQFRAYANFWEDFLAPSTNYFGDSSANSASSVSAYLTRLFTSLKIRCTTNSIKLQSLNEGNLPSSVVGDDKFGFGFSSYDGFWPSFDKKEANLLEKQAKVVNEVVDALASSTPPDRSITLHFIKREAVGTTDSKHIEKDMVSPIPSAFLIRNLASVKSYRFQVSFTGRTENARSFINQLRPPFSVRRLQAFRSAEYTNSQSEVITPFNAPNDMVSNETDILPIIRDIKTRFEIDLEYIYHVPYNYKDLLAINDWENTKDSPLKEVLESFQKK